MRIEVVFIEDGIECIREFYCFEFLGLWISNVDHEAIQIKEVITHECEGWDE